MIIRAGSQSSLREAEALWSSLLEGEPGRLPLRMRRDLAHDTRCLDLSTHTLRVAIDAARIRTWVAEGSLSLLGAALDEATSGAVELALVPLEITGTFETDSSYSFDSFITSPSNQSALELASEFASGRLRSETSLFVSGPRGSGKTHLLRAVAGELDRRNPTGEVIFRSAEELSLELIGAIWNHGLPEFRARLAGASALILDDIQDLAGREATQDELVRALSTLAEVPVVFSVSKSAEQMLDLMEPLRERIRSGTALELIAPEWETRVAIILDRIRRWQVQAEPEVATFLAGKLRADLQRIDSVLTRLLTHPSCRSGLSDLEVVRHLLDEASRHPLRVAPEEVISTVARHFNLRQRDLRSSTRSRRVAGPRQIAMYLLRQHCGLSYPEIGRRFERHHTTALHSVRLTRQRLNESAALRSAVALLEKELLRRSEESG